MINVSEPAKTALKSLVVNKMRSALTVLGIIIGVAAVIVVVCLVRGLEKNILKDYERAGSQMLDVQPANPQEMAPEKAAKVRSWDLTLHDIRSLHELVPRIRQISPYFFTFGTQVKCGTRSSSSLQIITDDGYLEANNIGLSAGRNFVPSDIRIRTKVAIIGPKTMEKLGLQNRPLGANITVGKLNLEVVGVLESRGSIGGYDRDDLVIIPLTTGEDLLTESQKSRVSFQIRLQSDLKAEEGAEMVREGLRRVRGLRPGEPDTFTVSSSQEMAKMVGTATKAIASVAGGMVSIALLVGGIGIMNVMLMSVTERTREIGVRKAVGAKRKDVLLQFLVEASLLSVLGGAIGIVVGTFSGLAISHALVGEYGAPPTWAILCAFAVPALIGLVFGLWPAAKAAKLDPIEALRYE